MKNNNLPKIVAFVIGFIFIFLGGLDFLITTIPGIGLIIWSITGKGGLLR
jgi:hypothetical protein